MAALAEKRSSWLCPVCSMENTNLDATRCSQCGARRPAQSGEEVERFSRSGEELRQVAQYDIEALASETFSAEPAPKSGGGASSPLRLSLF